MPETDHIRAALVAVQGRDFTMARYWTTKRVTLILRAAKTPDQFARALDAAADELLGLAVAITEATTPDAPPPSSAP